MFWACVPGLDPDLALAAKGAAEDLGQHDLAA